MSQREQNRLANQMIPLAIEKATANGLVLTVVDLADSHFRLSYSTDSALVWLVDLWPTESDWSRVHWDPDHKGPVLALPRPWTILDAVDAMIAAKAGQVAEGRAPVQRMRPKPILGNRRRRRR